MSARETPSGATGDGKLVRTGRPCLHKITLASAASAVISRGKSVCARKSLCPEEPGDETEVFTKDGKRLKRLVRIHLLKIAHVSCILTRRMYELQIVACRL